MENEKYPYQKEWEDFRKRKLIPLILFIGSFPIGIILIRLFELFGGGGINVGLVYFIIFAALLAILSFRLKVWKCPKCRNIYQSLLNNFSDNKCHSCKLPKYFGSSFFQNYWGTERANELIKKNKDHGEI